MSANRRQFFLHSSSSCFRLFLVLWPFCSIRSLTTALSFEFDGSQPAGQSKCPRGSNSVCLQGDAFVLTAQQVLYLTANQRDKNLNTSVGRAVYSEPLHLWTNYDTAAPDAHDQANSSRNATVVASFTTEFSFAIDNLGRSNAGDGIAFFLAHYPSTIPISSTGRCLGLLTESADTTNIPNVTDVNASFVAVEFDSFQNFYDFSSEHVGIDINSILSSKYVNLESQFQGNVNGTARVEYNGSTGNLSVRLEYAGKRYSLGEVVPVWEILPEWVSVGLTAATGEQIELHKIFSWKFDSSNILRDAGGNGNSSTSPTGRRSNGTSHGKAAGLVAGVTVAIVVSLLLCAGALVLFHRRRHKRAGKGHENVEHGVRTSSDEDQLDPAFEEEIQRDEQGPRKFQYKDLYAATARFSNNRKLGAGGFGVVYHGILHDESGLAVAIKKVSKDSRQGKKEFKSEIRIFNRLRHRNLVQLLGWCHARGELMLVYEFMPNGSLDHHLHGERKRGYWDGAPRLMLWPARYKVALGLVSALLYLHEEWHQCVLHRDIKPSNVMLDSDFEAKLGDFGLARLIDHGGGLHTTAPAGTLSYMAPESRLPTYRASKASDVYSLGVVLLEIASGRRPNDPPPRGIRPAWEEGDEVVDGLVGWVWMLYGQGRIREAADEKLDMAYVEQKERLLLVGLWCAHPDPQKRPSMKQVDSFLNCAAAPPELPHKMPVPVCHYPEGDSLPGTSCTMSSDWSRGR